MVMAMVMVMVMTIPMKMIMIDIHNHFMFGVDDGSKNIEMTEELLYISKTQGIEKIFLTPHVNSSVTLSNRSEHREKFKILKEVSKRYEIELFLGAEIYISQRLPDIDFKDYVMGESNYLLLEFSQYLETPIFEHCYNLMHRGFKIIIAHVERYRYLSIEDLVEIKNLGVLLQMNGSSIINTSNKKNIKYSRLLLKKGLIDFIASDSHNNTTRPQNLKQALEKTTKLIGVSKATPLFFDNQKVLIKK